MIFHQLTGELVGLGTGYSGKLGKWRNNPEFQQDEMEGCIPAGIYTQTVLWAGIPHEDPAQSLAGPVIRLTKKAVDSTRDGFLGHGDNCTHTASDGCIVMAHDIRVAWAMAIEAGDNELEVEP